MPDVSRKQSPPRPSSGGGGGACVEVALISLLRFDRQLIHLLWERIFKLNAHFVAVVLLMAVRGTHFPLVAAATDIRDLNHLFR